VPIIHIVNETELREVVSLDMTSVDVVEQGFIALASGKVQMPPIMHMEIPEFNGEMDAKSAYVPGFDCFAMKVSPGFFDNPKKGLPSLNGLMVLFSSETGVVRSVLLDNGYLTEIRTAAAGAVAAKYLARDNIETAGVLGTGGQARYQMEALHLVRPFKNLVVWGRNAENARLCADDLGQRLNVNVTVADNPDAVALASDVLVTATPSKVPLITEDGIHPGLHITAMGSDAPYKTEIAADVTASVDRLVVDSLAQCIRQGELRPVVEAGLNYSAFELGQLCNGSVPGRQNDDEITLCDLTGTGVQDTVIATQAYNLVTKAGSGQAFES
jgi:ectoine utilization protein EutC